MIIIDSVVNVLLPDMIEDLGSPRQSHRGSTASTLIFAALLVTVGLLADRFGRRRLFLTGTAVFLVGSLLAGAAMTPAFLIGARAVQAVGAAMMLPSSIAVINVLFTGRRRAVAFGLWGAVFGGAAALGPLLGGFLAEYWSAAGLPHQHPCRHPRRGPRAAHRAPRPGWPASRRSTRWAWCFPRRASRSSSTRSSRASSSAGGRPSPSSTWVRSRSSPVACRSCLSRCSPVRSCSSCWCCGRPARGCTRGPGRPSAFAVRRYGFGNVVALVVSLGEFGILFVLPLWMQAVHGASPLEPGPSWRSSPSAR
jgi:hypothetical protein